jgi:hypothetical protein
VTYEARVMAAQERLLKAAVAIGSMLVDEVDPPWDDQVAYEAAAVEYVKAIRGVPVVAESMDLALKAALIAVDGGEA